MSDLRSIDLYKFEKIFWMSSWYVLNFSNNSFAHFVVGSIWVDPYDEKYNYGDSKANRLRWVLNEESNKNVWILLLDLLELWHTEKLSNNTLTDNDIKIYQDCFRIWENLKLSIKDNIIEATTTSKLNHDFINEQISKCNKKIENGDFSWAITNGRTFLEAIMIEIIEEDTWETVKNNGKINKLFAKVKNILNLENRNEYPFAITQILEWIDKITSWLANLSNNIWDRHANKFNTKKHHAKIAVNCCMTLADFLLDSRDYQKIKSNNKTWNT